MNNTRPTHLGLAIFAIQQPTLKVSKYDDKEKDAKLSGAIPASLSAKAHLYELDRCVDLHSCASVTLRAHHLHVD